MRLAKLAPHMASNQWAKTSKCTTRSPRPRNRMSCDQPYGPLASELSRTLVQLLATLQALPLIQRSLSFGEHESGAGSGAGWVPQIAANGGKWQKAGTSKNPRRTRGIRTLPLFFRIAFLRLIIPRSVVRFHAPPFFPPIPDLTAESRRLLYRLAVPVEIVRELSEFTARDDSNCLRSQAFEECPRCDLNA